MSKPIPGPSGLSRVGHGHGHRQQQQQQQQQQQFKKKEHKISIKNYDDCNKRNNKKIITRPSSIIKNIDKNINNEENESSSSSNLDINHNSKDNELTHFEYFFMQIKEKLNIEKLKELPLQKFLKNIPEFINPCDGDKLEFDYDEFLESADKCIESFQTSEEKDNDDNNDDDMDVDQDNNDENDFDQEYMVEKIVSKKITNGVLKYECKWQGYSSDENTWEKIQHLDNSLILVKQFENSLFKKPQGHPKLNIPVYEDSTNIVDELTWHTLKHLREIEEILAYDTHQGNCWVSFKNIGETAKIHVDIVKKIAPVQWLKFFRENRQKFRLGRMPSYRFLVKEANNLNN